MTGIKSRIAVGAAATLLVSGLSLAAAQSAQAHEVCGTYSHNGSRFWANCTSHNQVVIDYKWWPTGFDYVCVPAHSSRFLGASWQVLGAALTKRSC